MQGLRCHFISMPGKSPMKLEVTSRHDHSCLLGRKASKQTNKQTLVIREVECDTCDGSPRRSETFLGLKRGHRGRRGHSVNGG